MVLRKFASGASEIFFHSLTNPKMLPPPLYVVYVRMLLQYSMLYMYVLLQYSMLYMYVLLQYSMLYMYVVTV